MTQVPARYAVFGHPVAHSLSPRIHAAFAQQTRHRRSDYAAIDATPDDFAAALCRVRRGGGKGANVTLPHKQRGAGAVRANSASARAAPARSTR